MHRRQYGIRVMVFYTYVNNRSVPACCTPLCMLSIRGVMLLGGVEFKNTNAVLEIGDLAK